MITLKQLSIRIYFDGDFDTDFSQKDQLIEEVRANCPLFLEQLETRFYRCFYTYVQGIYTYVQVFYANLLDFCISHLLK